jgi:potassium-transporting ATPase KdpC subunit
MSDIKQAYESSHGGGTAEPGGSILGHIWASIGATIVLGIICCGIYPLIVYGIGQILFPIQANGSLLRKDGSYTTNDQEAVGSALIGQSFSAPQYFHARPSAAGSGYDGSLSGGSNLGPLSDKLINGVTATAPAPAPASEPSTAAATASVATTSPQVAATTTAPAVVETLSFDGVRLRVIHYAVDNGIAFKLYTVKFDDNGNVASKTEVPLSKYQDKDGNLKDTDLVDAFPHAGDPADKTPLIAADFATPIPADAVTASGSGLDPHISPENATLQAQRIADARKVSKDKVLQLIDQYTDRPNFGILGDPGVNVLRLNLALDAQAPMPAAPAATATSPATSK